MFENHSSVFRFLVVLALLLAGPRLLSAQNLNIQKSNITVGDAIAELNRAEGYSVVVNSDEVDMTKVISISARNASIQEVLDQIFAGQDVSYVIDGKKLSVSKKTQKPAQPSPAASPLTGKVVDESGEPLTGASIMIKGTTKGFITDLDGGYSITGVTYPVTIVVGFIGMDDREILLSGNERSPYNIVLSGKDTSLDEVVVVGYGTQKKVNLTGAVGMINGKDLNNRPVTSAAQALQGADPSLVLTMGNGSIEGKEYTATIRGQVSINSGSPLILIDGVEASLNQVNPNDIESVSVLKDASACAIYGTTASAGVVLITTKNGAAGDLKVNYSGRAGVAFNTTSTDFITCGYDYVNLSNEFTLHSTKGYNAWNYTDEEMQMLYERRNDLTEDPSRPWVLKNESGKYRYYGNFDWYGYMFRRSRPETEHNVSISGGNDKINYYVSGRALWRQGVFNSAASDTYSGYSFTAKVNAKVKKWLTYSGSVSLDGSDYSYGGYWEQDGSEGNVSQGILWNVTQNISPTLVPVNPDGTTMMYTNGIQFADSPIASGRGGVFTDGRNRNSRKNQYWIVTNRLTFNIIDGLKLVTDYTYRNRNKLSSYRSYTTANTWDKNMKEIVDFSNGSIYDFYEEDRFYYNGHVANAYLSFDREFGKNHISAVAGSQFQDYRSSTMAVRQKGSLSEKLAFIDMAQGTIEKCEEDNTSYRTLGFFARVNYDWAGKYLAEVSGRYDGSSRFAPNHRWAFYPSASVGWRISEEGFWDNIRDVWNNSKIRFSYGSLGNQQVSNYSYISTISTSQMTYTFDGLTKANYASTPSPITDGLGWETVITYNLGMDFGFFRNKLTASADFFIRDTKDMLTSSQELPAVFGASSPKINGADLRTKGYEITLSWKESIKVLGKPLYYSVGATLGDYVTHITKFDNPSRSLSQHYVGERLGDIWGYQVDGFFKTDAEAAEYQSRVNDSAVNKAVYNCGVASMAKLMAGDVKFVDRNNDGVINTGKNTVDDPGDRYIIGNTRPRYNYSLRGEFDWYGFNLSVFFQGVGKLDWMPTGNCSYFWSLYGFPASSFVPTNFEENTWTEDNRNAYFPRRRGYSATTSGGSMNVNSDYFLQNAAYIRLKNLTVGYSVPLKQTSKIQKIRVYLAGENLWYWSPLKKHSTYVDPEVATSSAADDCIYPYSRTVSAGIDITF